MRAGVPTEARCRVRFPAVSCQVLTGAGRFRPALPVVLSFVSLARGTILS